jgi:hypothetical protein
MRIYIGIDDTDNLESRGTGFRARELGARLNDEGLGKLIGITRHQLLFDQRIPYTSHNSSACLELEADNNIKLHQFCAGYLIQNSADGSDAGLCVAAHERIGSEILRWGERAKKEIVTQEEARKLASAAGVFLEGYTGTKGGIIGSLAAVGLRKGGNDGRFLWIPGMREMEGVFNAEYIKIKTGIMEIRSVQGDPITGDDKVFLGSWWRPVMKNNKIVLFVEPNKLCQDESCKWQIVSKDTIKSISN